jgi:hypothetical protein
VGANRGLRTEQLKGSNKGQGDGGVQGNAPDLNAEQRERGCEEACRGVNGGAPGR